MNPPDLQLFKNLECFSPVDSNITKYHIFHNISKCSICALIPFKYKITCNSYENIKDK